MIDSADNYDDEYNYYTDERSTTGFKKVLELWLLAYYLDDETTIHSHEDWLLRHEDELDFDCYHLHVTSEGGLYKLYNEPSGSFSKRIDCDLLTNFARHHGWHVEQGYPWSWHFMPMSQFDDLMYRLDSLKEDAANA